MRLTENFSTEEFTCKCGCNVSSWDMRTVNFLQKIRDHFNFPIKINSAYRCSKWNKKVGGGKKSFHLLGMAIDFTLPIDMKKVYAWVLGETESQTCGIGFYPLDNFIHLDCRGLKVRWYKKKDKLIYEEFK